jgi:hypothetical protein
MIFTVALYISPRTRQVVLSIMLDRWLVKKTRKTIRPRGGRLIMAQTC